MKSLLIYYGYPNSFNSATNSWNNENVAQEMSKYDLIVFGNGIESTGHGDNANINIILPRIRELKLSALQFGYVTINQSFANFTSKVDDWIDNRDVNGIFMDEAGYDYGSISTNSRIEFNKKVDYCHSKGLLCFVNAWKIEHIIGENNDVSYPDTTWNSNGLASNLNTNDWYLLESHVVNSCGAYEDNEQWYTRGDNATKACKDYGINLAAIGCLNETDENVQDKFDFMYTSAEMWSLHAMGSGDYDGSNSYGPSNAKTKLWTRPNTFQMGENYSDSPSIEVDNNDSNVYMRYVERGKLELDFSSGSECSTITKW